MLVSDRLKMADILQSNIQRNLTAGIYVILKTQIKRCLSGCYGSSIKNCLIKFPIKIL